MLFINKKQTQMRSIITRVIKNEHRHHQVWDFLSCYRVLHTYFFKNSVSTKVNLDNYNGHIDPIEHIQNIRSIVKLVMQKSDVICKIYQWYFIDMPECSITTLSLTLSLAFMIFMLRLIFCLITSISIKKSMLRIFSITR